MTDLPARHRRRDREAAMIDRRYIASLALMIAGLLTYVILGKADLAALNMLGAIWLKLP